MNKYQRRSLLALACIVSFAVSAPADWCHAESAIAKENLEKLKKTNSCRGCDLSGLTMNRMNLAGADLEGADLSMAKFFLTNLSSANLKNSNLKGASFGGSDLGEADLRGADLRGTSLDGAYLGETLLDGEFVTAKPYEDIGVSDVEKQIYIDDPNKPKKSPETREVNVADRRDAEESQPPHAREKSTPRPPFKKDVNAGGAETVVAPTVERQPDAPVAKKAAPVQRAIVDPHEEIGKAGESAASMESPEKKDGKDKAGNVQLPAMPHPPGKSDISSQPETALDAVATRSSSPYESFADSGIGDVSKRLAKEKIKRDNLARLFDKAQCPGCDLSGLDLSGRDLKNVDLEKSNLTGCNLEMAILDNANLKEAILRNTNLRKASLRDADLHNAELSGADLTGANVIGAMFDNAKTASAVGLAP